MNPIISTRVSRSIQPPAEVTTDDLLEPVMERAARSESLMPTQIEVSLQQRSCKLTKLMLLGARGGGKPARIALLGGLDSGSFSSVAAVGDLLLELAIFAYPTVNPLGFEPNPAPLENFQLRYAEDAPDADVQFLKGEMQNWAFDGSISLRTSPTVSGLHVRVRSEILAHEVVTPALQTLARKLSLHSDPVEIMESSRLARKTAAQTGRSFIPSEGRSRPFEIEIFVPANQSASQQKEAFCTATLEILKHYRRVFSQAQNI
jgi:hypothetical protein